MRLQATPTASLHLTLLLAALPLAVMLQACSAPTDDVASAFGRIIGGWNDLAESGSAEAVSQARRDATVLVLPSNCSGTLITPRLVATAAHCVDQASEVPVTAAVFGAVVGSRVGMPVVACFRHLRYNADLVGDQPSGSLQEWDTCGTTVGDLDRRSRYDIAVLVLAERVELNRAGSISVIPTDVTFEYVDAPTEVRIAGWGALSNGGTFPGTRQMITAPVEGYFDELTPLTGGAIFVGSDLAAGGDSGGTWTIGDPEVENLTLIGVHSGSKPDDANPQNRTWAAPLSSVPTETWSNEEWLRQFIEAPINQPGTLNVPLWAGDWDLPLRGEPERNNPVYASLVSHDRDGDGLIDSHDNCPAVWNPEQRDGGGTPNGVDVALDGVADFADCAVVPLMVAVM